jgi:hypothetical protein
VRYPELLLKLQAVYGFYHLTDPQVFLSNFTEEPRAARGSSTGTASGPMDLGVNFIVMFFPGSNSGGLRA